MPRTSSSFYLWLIALALTISIAYFQRVTGPTHPVSISLEFGNQKIETVLPRSGESGSTQKIELHSGGADKVSAELEYRRFRSDDEWFKDAFVLSNGNLVAELPSQPPAGKLEYRIRISGNGESKYVTENAVVIRFKGKVPTAVLILHIAFMFLAMLFSARAGIEAIRNGSSTRQLTTATLAFLALGGMILGPVVQNYAFGAYWTGWPFGSDLTDNKTLIAFLGWVMAFTATKMGWSRKWVVAAAVILFAVYLIPHSMFGSELDYSTGKVGTGN